MRAHKRGVKKLKLHSSLQKQKAKFVVFAVFFGAIGGLLLLKSFAATPYISFETEQGQVLGAASIVDNDSQASKGSYVVFGNGTAPTRYEAEDSDTNALIIRSGKDYASNKAVVGTFGSIGQYVTFTVNVPTAKAYPATIRYASAFGGTVNSGPDPLPRTMLINNAGATTVNFARTTTTPDNWDSLVSKSLGSLNLVAGSNTVTFRIDANESQYWDVDYLEISGATVPATCPTGQTGTPPNCTPIVMPPSGNGVGGSGANMNPGRKCAAASVTNGASTLSSGGNLQNAINNLGNGGVLVVGAGTYGGVSISGRNNLTICGVPGVRPKVSPNGGAGFNVSGSFKIHIEGFEVGGNQGGGERGVSISGNAHHIAVWDMYIHDVGNAGIGAFSTRGNDFCGHVDIRYNKIWNTSYNDPDFAQSGITIYEPRNCGGAADLGPYSDFIIGNIGYHNGQLIGPPTDGNCIIWDDTLSQQNPGSPYTSGKVLIANNLCVGNGGRGVHIGPSSARADVVNNTDYYNLNPAFISDNDQYNGQTDSIGSFDVRFINNVSIARPGLNAFDVYFADGQTNRTFFKSSNIFNRVTRDMAGKGQGYQVLADPGFTNASENSATWNFKPRSGSPLINAGIGSYSDVIFPKVDITGKTRSNTNPSIGAYEP